MNIGKIQDIEKVLQDRGTASVLLVCGNSFRRQGFYEIVRETASNCSERWTRAGITVN